MALSILTNVSALRVRRQLLESSQLLGQSVQELSSGERRLGAAEISFASTLRKDARLAGTALRNANDGISLLSVVDGAMSAITSVLTRMEELAAQASTETFTDVQRSAMHAEFIALGSEIERISQTTRFNGMRLLNGGRHIVLQIGVDGSAYSRVALNPSDTRLMTLSLAGQRGISVSLIDQVSSVNAARSAMRAVQAAMDQVMTARGSVGASESRLHHAVGMLAASRENFLHAESRIKDSDIADAASTAVRMQILQQVQMAVLAQANQTPQIALKLLKEH